MAASDFLWAFVLREVITVDPTNNVAVLDRAPDVAARADDLHAVSFRRQAAYCLMIL